MIEEEQDKRDKNKRIRRTEHTVRTVNEVSEAPMGGFLGSVYPIIFYIIKRCTRKFTKSHHGGILKPDS